MNGLGVVRRWRGALPAPPLPTQNQLYRYNYTPEEAAPPEITEMATGQNLLPQVDCKVGMKELSLETMIQTLFMAREDLRRSSLEMNRV